MSTPVYRAIDSTEPVARVVADALREQLIQRKKVLWLIAGGSSIKVAIQVSELLQDLDASNLIAMLTDERYGEIGHTDSNWAQLLQKGFKFNGAQLRPVIQGKDFEQTVEEYGVQLERSFEEADIAFGLFGIGADGHTAGILPDSPAVDSSQLAAGYDAGQFVRITITPTAIIQLDEAWVYAVGQEKWPVIEQLATTIDCAQQPAQFLKQAKKLTIFSDYPKGEKV